MLPYKRFGAGAVWITLALLFWLNSPYDALPHPGEVARAMASLWMTQGLGRELWSSFTANLQALAITSLISLPISYLAVLPSLRPLSTMVSKGRFLGLTGITFLFTLVFRGGHALKISLLVFGMSVFLVAGMAEAVMEIPAERFGYARTLRMSELRVFWEVVVLGTIPCALEAIRQNAAMGWMMLTMVEGISRSEGGVGAMLLNQNKHFHLAEVFAIQVLILAVGMAQDYGIQSTRKTLCPYAKR